MAWQSDRWATSTKPYCLDRTKKLTSPELRSGLSSVKPEKVTTLHPPSRAAATALMMFGERPELEMVTTRSPGRAWNSSCLAKTCS